MTVDDDCNGGAERLTPQRQPRVGGVPSLGALVASAAQVLAPNSLQFSELDFQRCVLAVTAWAAQCHDR